MQELEKIWMNGELVDWADAKVHVGIARAALRLRRVRGHPRATRPEGAGRLPADRAPAAAARTRRKLLYMELPYSRRGAPRRLHELIGANGAARVLPAPDRVLRLRRARRLVARATRSTS